MKSWCIVYTQQCNCSHDRLSGINNYCPYLCRKNLISLGVLTVDFAIWRLHWVLLLLSHLMVLLLWVNVWLPSGRHNGEEIQSCVVCARQHAGLFAFHEVFSPTSNAMQVTNHYDDKSCGSLASVIFKPVAAGDVSADKSECLGSGKPSTQLQCSTSGVSTGSISIMVFEHPQLASSILVPLWYPKPRLPHRNTTGIDKAA